MTFQEWLITEKQYSERAARDVSSRLKRALGFAGQGNVTAETLSKLESNAEFQALSMSVKSQMRRAVKFQAEFAEKNK